MRAIIIGGGIAGLASALALTRRGWQVEVFERAPEFTEVGAGLSLWPNALRALDALGWVRVSAAGPYWRGRPVSGTPRAGGFLAPTPLSWSGATGRSR